MMIEYKEYARATVNKYRITINNMIKIRIES